MEQAQGNLEFQKKTNQANTQNLKTQQKISKEQLQRNQQQARKQNSEKAGSSSSDKNSTPKLASGESITKDGSRTTQKLANGSTATLNQAVTTQAVTLDTGKLQAIADEENNALDAANAKTARNFNTTANSAQKFGDALDQATAKVGGSSKESFEQTEARLQAQRPKDRFLTQDETFAEFSQFNQGKNIGRQEFDQISSKLNQLANGNEGFAAGRAKVEQFSLELAKKGIDPRSTGLEVNLGEGKFRNEILAALATAQQVTQAPAQNAVQSDVVASAFDRAAASANNLATAIDAILKAAGIAPSVTTQAPTPVKQLFTGGSFAAGEVFTGNERGPELVTLGDKTSLLGDGTPGLFQADRAGYVLNAPQTAAILAGIQPGAIATAKLATATANTSGGSDRAIVAQLQALRADVANLQPDGGEYHFHREDQEALAMTFRLQQGLQRARYRR